MDVEVADADLTDPDHARGLVEISGDERDRLASRARLTPAGQAARDAIVAYRRKRIAERVRLAPPSPASLADLADLADAFDAHR